MVLLEQLQSAKGLAFPVSIWTGRLRYEQGLLLSSQYPWPPSQTAQPRDHALRLRRPGSQHSGRCGHGIVPGVNGI